VANPFTQNGALPEATEYAALSMNRYISGLITQASQLSDPAVPYLQEKFYSASRYDRLIDGLNIEMSSRMTPVRAPGSSVFNSNTFPAANSFYPWKTLRNNVEAIRVLEDGADGTLYDATPGQISAIFAASAGAGPNRMLGLPNAQFYAGNGVDQKKWLFPGGWQASTNVLPGTLINQGAEPGVLYMALGGITVPVVATAVSGAGSSWQHLVYVNPQQVPANFANLVGVEVAFSGLTTDTTLNGQTLAVDKVLSSTLGIFQVTTTTGAAQAYTPDTGQGTTGNGTTNGTVPTFNATRLAVTQDAGQQWKCYGPAVQNTGLVAPLVPPTLTPVAGRFWLPNTAFPQFTSLLDSNGNIEVVASTSGTNRSGPVYPTWSASPAAAQLVATNLTGVPAATGNNFNTVYQNTSPNTELHSGWGLVIAGNSIAVFDLLVGPTNPPTMNTWGTTFTATDRAGTGSNGKLGFMFSVPPGWFYNLGVAGDVSGTPGGWDAAAQVPVATGIATPGGANAVTVDGGLTWYNLGQPGIWQADAANAGVTGSCLIDSNGNLQWLFDGAGGTSGVTEPTWGTTLGAAVTDGGLTWKCISVGGSGSSLSYQSLQYAYSTHAVDGSVSTASPVAVIYGGVLGEAPAVLDPILTLAATSPGLFTDPQIDQIWIWRTVQGGATLILEDQIPADGLTNTFSYGEAGIADASTLGLASLNALIPAPVADANDPPTATSLPMCYAFQRVWWADGNLVRYSGGPDTLAGNGNTAQPPVNFIAFLGKVYAIIPVTVQNGGLIVYTSSGIQIILGTGTATNPFYSTTYYRSVNVVNYNAISLFNTTMFVMEATGKVSAIAVEYPFNPATGYTEIGQPIGDQFQKVTTGGISTALYNPATAFVAWNSESTEENALYVADGVVGWFRLNFLNNPESGAVWSPRRAIAGGTSAVQSIETSPGINQLLIGPAAGTTGPILVRDSSTNQDDGTDFGAPYATIGGLVLAGAGEVAEIAFVTLDSVKVGTAPTIAMLFGEIAATVNAPFVSYLEQTADPPLVKRTPQSVYAQRFEMLQGKVTPKCRYLQMKVQWTAENAASELLAHAIYGAKKSERKQQP